MIRRLATRANASPARRRAISFPLLAIIAALPLAAARENPATGSELGLPLVQNFLARDIPTTRHFFAGAPRFYSGVSDEAGLLYFCHKGAVVTYNGTEWNRIPTTPEALNIRGVAFGPDGRLYVGGSNFFGRLRRPDWKYESLLERLPETARDLGAITQIVTHDGAVHVVSTKYLIVLRDERFTVIACNDGRLHATQRALYFTAPNQPLRRVDRGALVIAADDRVFRTRDIRLVCDGSDGALIVCPRQGGLYRLSANRAAGLAPFPTEADELLRTKQVEHGRRLDDGTIALALSIASGGTAIFLQPDGRCAFQLDENSGLQDEIVLGFLPDRDGGLWLSLGSGLARVQWPSAFTYFGRANGLDIGSRYAVVRHRGALYVANTRGLFRLARGHPPASSAHFERVFAGETWDIEPWHDGLLLTMTRDLRWLTPGGEVRSIHRSPGATRFSVARASALDTNRIWLGQSDGMRSLYYGDGAWRDEGLVAGVTGNIATIVEDGERTLWCAGPGTGFVRVRFAASTAGAARPAVADVTQFTAGHGLPQTVSTGGAVRWGDEILFTISGSNALLRFNAARDAFEPAPGLQVVDEAIALTPGSGQPGHVWLAADDSQPSEWRIHRVERDGKFLALPQTTNQPIGAAFRFLEEPNPDGDVLWVGGNEGLMRVDLTRAFAPPTPLVAQVRPIGFSSGAQRSYAERDVELAYFAPRFQTGAVVDYQSRLEGYEGAWSDWSAARKRSFTNLPPGSYRFVVRARDTDGMMSAPVDVAFAILPPWWRTWWFLGLVGLSGIGGVAGITRWFATRALRRRVALLEAQSAVERERLRLARDLHDEVGSGLGRVILFAGEADRTVGDPTKQRAALARVRGAAQELVQHAREIVWAVSPQHDTLASVIERLGDYADETLRAAGIACAVQSPPAEKIPPLTLGSEARHSLFLALKEAVHNCVKYSGAKTAELTLAIVGDAFVITLRDYGRGFAPGERRGSGNGTKNIIARAEALGGSAEIVSEPGKGTTVVLRVPLR